VKIIFKQKIKYVRCFLALQGRQRGINESQAKKRKQAPHAGKKIGGYVRDGVLKWWVHRVGM